MKTIKIDELEKISKLIFDKLKAGKIDEINLDEDYYWHIASGKKFKLNDTPEPIIGSIVDDWEELIKLLSDKERPVTYVDFDRLAALLQYLSEKLNSTTQDT